MTSTTGGMDEAIRAFIEEVSARENADNAVYIPLQNAEPLPETPTKKKKGSTTKKNGGWVIKEGGVGSDTPSVNWTDAGFQYTVQNPANYGTVLLKMQLFDNGRPTHSCAIFLNREDEAYASLTNLVKQLENAWVDGNTGEPKVDGLIQTMTPLASWRKPDDCTTAAAAAAAPTVEKKVLAGKRKRVKDCNIPSDAQLSKKRSRPPAIPRNA